MNIVLVGMMGSGKSTLARVLAEELGMFVSDTDSLVVAWDGGISVRDIFARYGEAYFRQEESGTIDVISNNTNDVIATGGGSLMDENNLKNLQVKGILFYLQASPEELYKRTGVSPERPLLDGLQSLKDLLIEREGQYLKADVTVKTDGRDIKDIAEEIKVKFLMIEELLK